MNGSSSTMETRNAMEAQLAAFIEYKNAKWQYECAERRYRRAKEMFDEARKQADEAMAAWEQQREGAEAR